MKLKSFPFARLTVAATVFAVFVNVVYADVYDHSGKNGTLTDGMWFDQTTGMHGVNPGPGDDAYFYGSTITASRGTVHLISGVNFTLSGMLTRRRHWRAYLIRASEP